MSGPFSFQQKQWKLPCFKSQRSVHPLCSEGSWQLKKKQKNKCWKLKMLKLLRYDYLREKTVCSSFTQHFPDVWFSPSILEFSARSNHLSKTSGWTSASHSHAKKGQAKFGLALTSRKTWSLDGFASPTVAYQGIKLSRVTITLIVFIYLTIRPHDG